MTVEKLTPRQAQMLALRNDGKTGKEIAAELHVSHSTVRGTLYQAYARGGVKKPTPYRERRAKRREGDYEEER